MRTVRCLNATDVSRPLPAISGPFMHATAPQHWCNMAARAIWYNMHMITLRNVGTHEHTCAICCTFYALSVSVSTIWNEPSKMPSWHARRGLSMSRR